MASNTRSVNRQSCFVRIVATLLLAAWAFVSLNCEVLVPRHGWSEDWGPLVPHLTFPGDCGTCHVPERWDVLRQDFAFDHEKETGYALAGAHAKAACLRCHNDRGPVALYVARGCGGCHPDPHQGTLGLDCTRCHVQATWSPVGLIAEHARTQFPLFGAHAAAPCERCHLQAPVGIFVGAPKACELCHQDDLATATSPDHTANGWVTRCERCHTPAGWSGANFSHNFFPLAGGHSGLECIRCHTSGSYGPIPSDCFSCHQDDYQRAPNHVTQQYPTDCRQCHTIASWEAASFNHRFPLAGPHSKPCATCHQGGNLRDFTCFACHEHEKTRMDDKHREVGGYVYESRACYQCHPTGKK